MMAKFLSTVFPIVYRSWDEGPGFYWVKFNDVEFTADFGPVKRGTQFHLIEVDLCGGQMILGPGEVIQWKAVSLSS